MEKNAGSNGKGNGNQAINCSFLKEESSFPPIPQKSEEYERLHQMGIKLRVICGEFSYLKAEDLVK